MVAVNTNLWIMTNLENMNKDESGENSDWKFYDWTCWFWLVMINGGHILFLVNSWVIVVNLLNSQKVKGFSTTINPYGKMCNAFLQSCSKSKFFTACDTTISFPFSFWHHRPFLHPKAITKHPYGKHNSRYVKVIKNHAHYYLVYFFSFQKMLSLCSWT